MAELSLLALLATLSATIGAASTWLALRQLEYRHSTPPIEVLVADRRRRQCLRRALRTATRQLDGAQRVAAPVSAVIVQQVVWDGWGGDGGRQLHGCARRPARFAADPRPRLCLALEVDGRTLPLDEILATLAELWSLHLKGDDRDFVPIVFGRSASNHGDRSTTASRTGRPSPSSMKP